MKTHPTTLALSRIKPGGNPRRYFDQAKHDELVAGFRLRGMLQPMLLRPAPDGDDCFLIVAGGRRYRAALEVFGADGEVPVIIREMTDQEANEAAIDENDNRDDASETEQADAAVRALAACQDDRAEAARRLGWSPAKLDRRLALANLSEPVKIALDERRIKVGHAELLAAVPGDKQEKALETILTAGLDVAKTRAALTVMSQDLAGAGFDKTECATCPFNTALQRALFETHVDEGHCTNPGCYQLKTDEGDKARAAAAPKPDEAPAAGDKTPASPSPAAPAKAGAAAKAVTAESVADRAAAFREEKWRTAVGQVVAGNPDHADVIILAAAASGTLSQIKPDTLIARAGVHLGEAVQESDFKGKFGAIAGMLSAKRADALASVAAAYVRDVASFDHVTALAGIFDVDVSVCWQVDKAFLDLFGRDELRFIAQEVGLVAHMGAKPFAKLLEAKKDDIVAGMLNATGFDWSAVMPGAMSIDGAARAAIVADAPTYEEKD
jgi:ParB/RepB/Spo0J family partition protein